MDVFTAQGRDPSSQCRLTGAVKRLYDKQLHSYVYELEGGVSSTQSRIQIPKDDKNTCKRNAVNIICVHVPAARPVS